MALARVHNFAISLDGFGTGEGLSQDAFFGHAGQRLHEWMIATQWWQPGGSRGVDNAFVHLHGVGFGAEIMGTGKSGYPGWHDHPHWKGPWARTRHSTRRSSSHPPKVVPKLDFRLIRHGKSSRNVDD